MADLEISEGDMAPASLEAEISSPKTSGTKSLELPKDFYWPFRFIPVPEIPSDDIVNGPKLNQLCPKCVILRDWIVLNFDVKPSAVLPHYDSLEELIVSAHEGCHLCSILYTTSRTIKRRLLWEESRMRQQVVNRYEVTVVSKNSEESGENRWYLAALPAGKFYSEWVSWYYAQISQNPDPKSAASNSSCTSSPAVQKWATGQVTKCLLEHKDCNRFSQTSAAFVPTRLIDLGFDCNRGRLNLISTKDLDPQKVQYIALSYCWGGDQSFKLTASTKKQLYDGFDLELLPKTIRDAVHIAKWFNIRYIWVDALCIIQGDVDDWSLEAKVMDEVYRGSFLTIAAQGAKSSADGCFAIRSHLMHQPCRLDGLPSENGIFVDVPNFIRPKDSDSFQSSALCSRAWTVQERILCPRVLYFGATLRWACCESLESELTGKIDGQNFKSDVLSTYLPHGLPMNNDQDFGKFSEQWSKVMEEYTNAQITFPSDRVIALQGVITYLERCTGFENLAGLWRSALLPNLLWFAATRSQGERTNHAPSWSWLTMDSTVYSYPPVDHGRTELVECEVLFAQAALVPDPNRAGCLIWEGELHLHSFLISVHNVSFGIGPSIQDALFDQKAGLEANLYADTVVDYSDVDLFFLSITIITDDSMYYECIKYWGLLIRHSTIKQNAYERVGMMYVISQTLLPAWEHDKTTITLV